MNQSLRGRPGLSFYRRHTTACIGNNYDFRVQSSRLRFEESQQISVNEYEDPAAIVAHDPTGLSQAQGKHSLTAMEPHAGMNSYNSEM